MFWLVNNIIYINKYNNQKLITRYYKKFIKIRISILNKIFLKYKKILF